MITITGYSQTIDRNNIIARQKLQFSGGNPDSNKIAVSVDANGIFKWVYFTDFQDSVNTAIYDTGSFNAIRISAPFTDEIMSLGSDSVVTGCGFGCDDIRWKTVNGTQTVLKDSTDNVGIGTDAPTHNLHVVGGTKLDSAETQLRVGSFGNGNELHGAATYKAIGDFEYINGIVFDSNQGEEYYGLYIKDTTTGLIQSIVGYTDVTINSGLQIQDRTALEISKFGGAAISIRDSIFVTGTFTINGTPIIDIPSAATGYVLTSLNADGNATWQDPTAYGEMGFGDSTRTIAITQNVFSVVTNSNNTLWSTAAVDLHNVTYSGDSLIIDSAGTYQVNVQLSMDGTSGSVIRLGVFINGVLACSCTGYQELLNNRILQLTYINIDALNAGDVLQVVITNTANNDDVDAIGGKITVNKIR
jgi:hypothetical protein